MCNLKTATKTYPSSFAPTGAGSPEQTSGCPGADAIIAKMEERAVKRGYIFFLVPLSFTTRESNIIQCNCVSDQYCISFKPLCFWPSTF